MTKGFYQYGVDPDEVMLGTFLDKEHDVDAYCFLHGMCTVFAIVLNKKFGYPIYMLRDADDDPVLEALIHVFCVADNRESVRHYIDARGITASEDAFLDSFGDFFDAPVYQEVAPEEVERLCISDMGQETYEFYQDCANQLTDQFSSYYDKEPLA